MSFTTYIQENLIFKQIWKFIDNVVVFVLFIFKQNKEL